MFAQIRDLFSQFKGSWVFQIFLHKHSTDGDDEDEDDDDNYDDEEDHDNVDDEEDDDSENDGFLVNPLLAENVS